METLSVWLQEYCCKKKLLEAFKVIYAAQKRNDATKSCTVNTTRLYLMVLHDIVIAKFDVSKFTLAVLTVNEIYNGLSSDAISFKQYAKVTTGLKILALFQMLEKGNKLVLPRLNEFFPRTGVNHPKVEKKLAERLSVAQLRFRKFLLSLIVDKVEQVQYLKQGYREEYGEAFRERVKHLVKKFIEDVERQLPLTYIEKLAKVEVGTSLHQTIGRLTSPVVNLMLDMLCEEKELTEENILDLVKTMDTVYQKSKPTQEPNSKRWNNIAPLTNIPKCPDSTIQLYNYRVAIDDPSAALQQTASQKLLKNPVPLGKVYRMNIKANKGEKLITPEQVQTVSSSSEQDSSQSQNTDASQSQNKQHTTQVSCEIYETEVHTPCPDHTRESGDHNSLVTSVVDKSLQKNNCLNNIQDTRNKLLRKEPLLTRSECVKEALSPVNSNTLTLDSTPFNTPKMAPKYRGVCLLSGDCASSVEDNTPSSFHSCFESPQNTASCSPVDTIEKPILDRQRYAADECLTAIEDSEVLNTSWSDTSNSQDSTVLPSSYSMEKFEAIVCDKQRRKYENTLPKFDRHLKSLKLKLCVVKIYRKPRMDQVQKGVYYKMYS